jgi:hypothetical protein
MTTPDFIIALFYAVDQEMLDVPKHPEAKLYPSEVVTLALLFAIKGGGTRAFYRWLTRDYLPLFPHVPERTRLARLFKTHTAWTARFLAAPTVLGVADTYGIELIHPMREGRSPAQIGKKGKSNHRWIVGGKLCFILNQWGLICAWDCATANVHDTHFQPLIARFDGQMVTVQVAPVMLRSGSLLRPQGDMGGVMVQAAPCTRLGRHQSDRQGHGDAAA